DPRVTVDDGNEVSTKAGGSGCVQENLECRGRIFTARIRNYPPSTRRPVNSTCAPLDRLTNQRVRPSGSDNGPMTHSLNWRGNRFLITFTCSPAKSRWRLLDIFQTRYATTVAIPETSKKFHSDRHSPATTPMTTDPSEIHIASKDVVTKNPLKYIPLLFCSNDLSLSISA